MTSPADQPTVAQWRKEARDCVLWRSDPSDSTMRVWLDRYEEALSSLERNWDELCKLNAAAEQSDVMKSLLITEWRKRAEAAERRIAQLEKERESEVRVSRRQLR